MTRITLNRTINISVSVRIDQYQWLKEMRKKNSSFNNSKLFQKHIDKEIKKDKR